MSARTALLALSRSSTAMAPMCFGAAFGARALYSTGTRARETRMTDDERHLDPAVIRSNARRSRDEDESDDDERRTRSRWT